MTRNEKILWAVAALAGYELLTRSKTTAAATVTPYSGLLYVPGSKPVSNISGAVPVSGLAPDPLSGNINEIYGTGMTAGELAAMGYTPAQISSLALAGDPAISAILDFPTATPTLVGASADPVNTDPSQWLSYQY